MRIPIEDGSENDIERVDYNVVEDVPKISSDNIKSKIQVKARIGSENGGLISSAKINLYMLNGVSPKLVISKNTGEDGVVVFDNLEKGSYRVIAIADKRYFEKPIYKKWNEITISRNNEVHNILVIYRVKNSLVK